jgi:hypothetical protein
MCYLLLFEKPKPKNIEPISTFHPLQDVMVDLFYMLQTHEQSHALYLEVI